MTEIRRIRDDDSEPEQAVELWDRDCREDPDGAPLSRVGRHNLQRMLAMMAWHRESFCLVAVGADERIVGYVCARVESGDGLLPGATGEINEMYVTPEAPDAPDLRRRLVEAAVARLREHGAAGVIRSTLDVQDDSRRALLAGLGFEADLVTMSLYPEE
jgi:hypothetical protein